jgi:hypothetical protein
MNNQIGRVQGNEQAICILTRYTSNTAVSVQWVHTYSSLIKHYATVDIDSLTYSLTYITILPQYTYIGHMYGNDSTHP